MSQIGIDHLPQQGSSVNGTSRIGSLQKKRCTPLLTEHFTVVESPMTRSIPQITLELFDNLSSELLMIREVSHSGIVPNRTMNSMWEKTSHFLNEGLQSKH